MFLQSLNFGNYVIRKSCVSNKPSLQNLYHAFTSLKPSVNTLIQVVLMCFKFTFTLCTSNISQYRITSISVTLIFASSGPFVDSCTLLPCFSLCLQVFITPHKNALLFCRYNLQNNSIVCLTRPENPLNLTLHTMKSLLQVIAINQMSKESFRKIE